MSDVSQGEGWWQASDGKWYAPEQQSASRPAASSPGSGSSTSSGSSRSGFKFDIKKLSKEELITGVATFVLFISLFLSWFTASASIYSVSRNGFYHFWMYLVLLICLGILAYLVGSAGYDELPIKLPMPKQQLLLIGTGANAVLTILAFLFKPSGGGVVSISWGIGAWLGLIACIVAAAPSAIPAIKARTK